MRLLLFILTCMISSSLLQATHLVGGSLNYEYMGENPDGTFRYRIFSVTYTDCGADSNFPDPEGQLPVAIYANDLGNPDANKALVLEFILPLISFEEIVLEGGAEGCGVGANICVEQGNYETLVDLPLNFDGYWIYYDRCCRNDAVVNLSPQQGVGFSTYIPSPLIVNSSPFFSAPPTPFLCAGDTTSFLNSAIDPDGDLMVFSFINPYIGYGTAMNPNPGQFGYPDPLTWEVPLASYNPTFSLEQPFGPGGYAFINGATGLTSYMAPASGQYSIAVEIKEYRNGNLIGITRRDLQLTVITCPVNPAPDLSEESEGNVGYTEWSIDEGETLCFPIIFLDDNGDSLFLNSFGEVFDPGLVFPTATINTPTEGLGSVQADFCWETDCSQGREVPYFFGVTSTDNGCPPKSSSEVYTIQVTAFTGASMMEGQSTVCENTTETYSTDEMTDATYQWTITGGAIVSGDGSSEVVVDWGNAGSGSLTVIITNFRGCVGDPFDVDVAIQPLPVVDAGSDIGVCLGDSVEIGGTPTGPGGSFYIWGPNSDIIDNGIANPEVFPSSSTDYIVQVISANNCAASDTITVTVNEAQLVVSNDVSICQGTSTQLEASGGVNYTWSPSQGLDNPSIADPMADPNETTTYNVTIVDANNCTAEAEMTVTVFEMPVAMAGIDSTLCGLEVDLYASPSVGIGAWTASPGGSVAGAAPDAPASVMAEGTFEFTWSESTGNGLCIDEDIVAITFIENPTATPGIDDSACGFEYTLDATATAGIGAWTLPPGLNINPDLSDPTGVVTADAYGVYTLTWAESNQMCTDMANLELEFVEDAIADAGMDVVLCGDTYTLSPGTTIGAITWSGPDVLVFDDIGVPNSGVVTSEFGTQTVTLTTVSGGICTATDEVLITFNEMPVSNAGEDVSICGLDLNLAAAASVGTGTWSGNPDLVFSDINDPLSGVQSSSYGTFALIWTEDTGECSDSDEVQITFLQNPIADAGADQDLCFETSTSLDATGGGSYSWSPSTGLTDSEIASPGASPIETTTYTVTVDIGNGCTASDMMTLTVLSNPEVDAGEDISYLCYGDSAQLQATLGLTTYSWSPTSYLSDPNISNPITGPFPLGTLSLSYTVTATDENNCEGSDTVVLVVNPDVPTDAGSDTLICSDQPVTLGALPVSPIGTTFTWSPDENINDITAEHPVVTPSQTTTYIVTSDNSVCTGSDQVTVIVEENPSIDFTYTISPTCVGLDVQFYNSGAPWLDYFWGFGDGSFTEDFSPSHQYAYATQYEVTLLGLSELGCGYSFTDTLDVTEFNSYFDIMTPNVITPNFDGENDVLDINITGDLQDCLFMEVFNRWGQLVFESTGNNTRWDGHTVAGELVQEGVYFYVVEFNGSSYKGSVQVIY